MFSLVFRTKSYPLPWLTKSNLCCCPVATSCQTLCNSMDCSTPGLPVPHHFCEFAQVHVHCISDAIQPSHPLMPSSPSALNLAQHHRLFQRPSIHIRWPGSMLDFVFSKRKQNPTCLLLITSTHLVLNTMSSCSSSSRDLWNMHPRVLPQGLCIYVFFCLKYHFPCSSKSRYHLPETFGPWSSHIIALLPLLYFIFFRATFTNQN